MPAWAAGEMQEDDLREELAYDDEDVFTDSAIPLPRGVPPPFAALPFPAIRFQKNCSNSNGSQTGSKTAAGGTEALANLCASLLGVGIFTSPKAFFHGGIGGGIIALITVAVASRQALVLIHRTVEGSIGDRPYLSISRRALGPQGYAVALATHMLLSGGLMVAYIVVLADILQGLAAICTGSRGPVSRWAVTLLTLLICTPGCMLRQLRYLESLGILCGVGAVTVAVYLIAASSTELLPSWVPGVPENPEGVAEGTEIGITSIAGVLTAARILTLQFAVHAGSLETIGNSGPAMLDVNHDERLSVLKSVSWKAYMVSAPLVCAVGIVGYLRYGDRVSGNVLLNFDFEDFTVCVLDVGFLISQLLYASGLVIGFAFLCACCRNSALELFLVRRASIRGSVATKIVRRTTLTVLAVSGCLAWFASDSEVVILCVSAWAAVPIAFILPAAISVELSRRAGRPRLHPSNVVAAALLLLAIVLTLSGLSSCVAFALSPPAGHRGHRTRTHSLQHITIGGR